MTPYLIPGMITTVDPMTIPSLCEVDFSKVKSRKQELVSRRQVAIALMAVFTEFTYQRIANPFRKDHATVNHCIRRMNEAVESNDRLIMDVLVPVFVVLYQSHKRIKANINPMDSARTDRIEKIDKRLNENIFSTKLIKGIGSGKYHYMPMQDNAG